MIQNFLKKLFCTENDVAAFSGAIFACLGLLVLIKNGIAPEREFHWWALFILLPSLLFFGCAWLAAHYRLPYRVSLGFFGLGLVVLMVAAIFLLNLNWETWWPLMLTTPMLSFFFFSLPDSTLVQKPEAAAWVSLMAWVSAAMALLGLTFLAGNFGLIDLPALTQRLGWWGTFILLCAAGAISNALWLWTKTGVYNLSVFGLVLVATTLLIAAVFELLGLDEWLELQSQFIAWGILLVLFSFMPRRKMAKTPKQEIQ